MKEHYFLERKIVDISTTARLAVFLNRVLETYPDAKIAILLAKVVRTPDSLCFWKNETWVTAENCGRATADYLESVLRRNGYSLRTCPKNVCMLKPDHPKHPSPDIDPVYLSTDKLECSETPQ